MVGRPLHYKEITEIAIEKSLLSHVGKSPDVTMGARLAATLKKEGNSNPLIRVKPGVFALRDWDEATIKQGLDIKRSRAKSSAEQEKAPEAPPAGSEEPASEPPPEPDPEPDKPAEAEISTADERSQTAHSATRPDWPDDKPPSPDEAKRAEMAADATGVFAAEDDDDQPILKRPSEPEEQDEAGPEPTEKHRRRRRRRRRGARSTAAEAETSSGEPLPSYTTSPAFGGASEAQNGGAAQRGPQVIELSPGEPPSLDGLAGGELSDAIAAILGSFDRTVGAVSLRQIAETAQRRGRWTGDAQLAQSQIAAAVRADNARRAAAGLRPRFRMAGGRVGMTEWLVDPELGRLERDALAALGRYREAARRALARKLSELPGHAFVELCVLLFERIGVARLRQVKFPGASGSEVHLNGQLYAPSAMAIPEQVGTGDGLGLAIVIRKDGRDIGRERVTELRGAVHHYGHCATGWLVTAGQVLSGAREEGAAAGVLPVTLLDGAALANLCEQYGVAVLRAQHPIAIPDVDLFEALKAS